jgi:glycerol-3-phosphate dehydrogenase
VGSVSEAAGAAATRQALFDRLESTAKWDLAVIGGGATGLGIALDAAARGHSVVLIEAHDFAKGTSSRATKLLHGGVRYMAKGHFGLVREALRERSVVLRNAPHLASPLAFVIPMYRNRDRLVYGLALKAYAWLAGQRSLGKTEWLGRAETLRALPSLRRQGLKGGVRYWDAQFDDARLAVALARTAAAQGALVLNYCEVLSLRHDAGRVCGLVCRERETGRRYEVRARCVVNATGVWADSMRRTDHLKNVETFEERVLPSRGTHIVLDASFLPSNQALMVPKTSDGRVLLAIPWKGHLLAGTTDAAAPGPVAEPMPTAEEVGFILDELGHYLERAPTRSDVRSAWAGLRPLVRPSQKKASTQSVSREHDISVSESGLVTVTGGKWTTYRVIADEALQTCISRGLMEHRARCSTEHLQLVGAAGATVAGPLHVYGSEAGRVASMPGAGRALCAELTEGMVRFAARYEYARTAEDVLARRSRLLFLDAKKAASCAEETARILREELGNDPKCCEFVALAAQYAAPLERTDGAVCS